jgi:hypothetical protein
VTTRAEGLPADPIREGPTWRQAYRLINRYRKSLLLPLLVTQLPGMLLLAVGYFIVLNQAFPEVDYQRVPNLQEDPSNYVLTLLVLNGVAWMFTLVGVAATLVATRSAIDGEATSLSSALDPGFTRLGGLIALGVVLLGITLATVAGIIVLIYVLWRIGLVLHWYVLGDRGVYGSLGRSWLSLRGQMLRFAGMLISLVPIVAAVIGIAFLATVIAILPFAFVEQGRTTELLSRSVGASIFGVFMVPISAYIAVATTIFYLNLRDAEDV